MKVLLLEDRGKYNNGISPACLQRYNNQTDV
jgi:hypothetical protein